MEAGQLGLAQRSTGEGGLVAVLALGRLGADSLLLLQRDEAGARRLANGASTPATRRCRGRREARIGANPGGGGTGKERSI